MYFLLKMGIFQPAMLDYRSVYLSDDFKYVLFSPRFSGGFMIQFDDCAYLSFMGWFNHLLSTSKNLGKSQIPSGPLISVGFFDARKSKLFAFRTNLVCLLF